LTDWPVDGSTTLASSNLGNPSFFVVGLNAIYAQAFSVAVLTSSVVASVIVTVKVVSTVSTSTPFSQRCPVTRSLKEAGVSESNSKRRDKAVNSKSLDRFSVNASSVVISVPSELELSTCVAVYVIVYAASLPSFVVKVNSSNFTSSRSAPMIYEKSWM